MVFSASKSESSSRWQRRKEDRPEEILNAALELFTEKGFAATRMDDVAKNAGISKGTLYNYFESKESIFYAVVQEMVSPEIEKVEAMVASYTGPTDHLLRQLIRAWWTNVGETRLSAIPKIVISESGNFPELAEFFVETIVKRARKLFTAVVSRGVVSGEFNLLETQSVVRLIIAPLVYATVWQHSLQPFDDDYSSDEYVDLHIKFILKSLIKDQRFDV